MYRRLVEWKVRRVFDHLSAGRWLLVLRDTRAEVAHSFAGAHALGGQRHTRDALSRWFERLFRLFPTLRFEVDRVAVRGWPWSTWVAVEWTDHFVDATGLGGVNHGVHWIHLRWGRVAAIRAHLDTQVLADVLRAMAAAGVGEAAAAPVAS